MNATKLTQFAYSIEKSHRLYQHGKIMPAWIDLSRAQQAKLLWTVRQYIVTVRDHGQPPTEGDPSQDLFRYIVFSFSDDLNPKPPPKLTPVPEAS